MFVIFLENPISYKFEIGIKISSCQKDEQWVPKIGDGGGPLSIHFWMASISGGDVWYMAITQIILFFAGVCNAILSVWLLNIDLFIKMIHFCKFSE